jgi:hypothetical protein
MTNFGAKRLKHTLPDHTILTAPAHVRENILFRGAAVAGGKFKLNGRKN